MDVTISNSTSWQSLNELSGITAGTALVIQNKGTSWFILQEASEQPDDDNTEGTLITTLYESSPSVVTDDGDEEIWVRPVTYSHFIKIDVQEG